MKLARLPDGTPEIFHTIQGEGRNAGMPAVFVRSSICNLHCRWCDTDYTWNWEGTPFRHIRDSEPGHGKFRREDQIVEIPVEELVDRVSAYPCRNYVFTGGEPLLHEADWVSLMDGIGGRRTDHPPHFEVETNGTRLPGGAFLSRIHQLNVSPKLENSGVAAASRLRPEVLAALAETGKADFKFVISMEEDFREMERIVRETGLPPDRIFLMPEALTVSQLESNQTLVARLARDHGFRYSDRLHLRLFGARRGN